MGWDKGVGWRGGMRGCDKGVGWRSGMRGGIKEWDGGVG